MEGHEQDPVVGILHGVDIRHQGDLLQEAGEAGPLLRIIMFLIVRQLGKELLHVPDPVLGVLIVRILQGGLIAGFLQDMAQKV